MTMLIVGMNIKQGHRSVEAFQHDIEQNGMHDMLIHDSNCFTYHAKYKQLVYEQEQLVLENKVNRDAEAVTVSIEKCLSDNVTRL